ncbi:MAG: exo-alpha-sialidase [Actinomycetota bacterium]|nr:exo-alpha-sialidase [Actinomycetota bacterium]
MLLSFLRRRLALLLAILALGSLAAACGADSATVNGSEDAETAATSSEGPALEHIHGLGVGDDGRMLIATHHGLFAAENGETTPKQISEHTQDIMGFAAVSEDRLIGSGHPSAQQNLPPHLGLIESRDGGKTWKNVSLPGEADFHALEASGDKIYGYNGLSGELLVSSDGGRNWRRETPPAAVFDLAVDPENDSRVVASTEQGVLMSTNSGKSWRPLRRDMTGLVAWSADDDQLYLVDGQGNVHASSDAGRRWKKRGNVGGQPVAFTASDGDLYAAHADGTVVRSDDGGDGWTVRTTAS